MTDPVLTLLLELRERVTRLEHQRADDGYWTTIQAVDADTASITTAEGRKLPIWSMSSRLVIQPVAGDQCLVMRGLAVCGVRPHSAGEDDGDVDMIRGVLRHDRATGEVAFANGDKLLALAELCDGEFNKLATAFAGATDSMSGTVSITYTPASVAATKVKGK